MTGRRLLPGGTLLAAALAVACSGGGPGGGGGTPTAPTPTPPGGGGSQATITIGSDGRVSPSAITISPGTQVSFVNNDSRAHDMASDAHPEHRDCPALNQVGFLQPGQSRQTGTFTTTRTCGFHDHNRPTDAALQGTITIQ